MLQRSYIVTIKIVNVRVQDTDHYQVISAKQLGRNKMLIINCQFILNTYGFHLFSFDSSNKGNVKFINCRFENNKNNLLQSQWHYEMLNPSLIEVRSSVKLELNNCNFYAHRIQTGTILHMHNSNSATYAYVIIKNTSFTFYTFGSTLFRTSDLPFTISFIILSYTNLQMEDSVIFSNITSPYNIISLKGNSRVIISGSVDFSYNKVHKLINFHENEIKYVIMKENSVIDIAHNEVWELFATKPTKERYPYPFCLFQYFSNSTSDSKVTVENRNYLIRFYNNDCKQEPRSSCFDDMPITNCQWLLQTELNNTIPLEVNNHYMQFINNSGTYNLSQIVESKVHSVCVLMNYIMTVTLMT